MSDQPDYSVEQARGGACLCSLVRGFNGMGVDPSRCPIHSSASLSTPIPPDPARAAFVAQVREKLRRWQPYNVSTLSSLISVCSDETGKQYMAVHGWPSTLRAIAEALDEEPK